MTKLLEKNTPIPTSYSQVFTTAGENQSEVTIRVLQGERPMSEDNKQLGQFQLTGIRAARRGEPKIEVTFDINADGILEVRAKDQDTNAENSITIQGSSNLSQEEIDRMTTEAEKHKEEDEAKKNTAVAKNNAEQVISRARSEMNTIEESGREAITKAIEEVESVVKAGVTKDIEEKTNALSTALQNAEKTPQAQPSEEGQAPEGGNGAQNTSENDNGNDDTEKNDEEHKGGNN